MRTSRTSFHEKIAADEVVLRSELGESTRDIPQAVAANLVRGLPTTSKAEPALELEAGVGKSRISRRSQRNRCVSCGRACSGALIGLVLGLAVGVCVTMAHAAISPYMYRRVVFKPTRLTPSEPEPRAQSVLPRAARSESSPRGLV